MKKVVIIVVIAAVVVGGGAVLLTSNKSKSANQASKQTAQTSTPKENSTDQATTQTSTPTEQAGTKTVAITADDTSATPDTVNVNQGDKVVITFNVKNQGVYHGGLEFKSADPVIESDPIDPGESGNVTFTATKSFKFTPYWYQSGVKKDYQISVNVL
ncbi:MAG TPA: cupredoxin domain-containing protein [Candidatus Saccharimonadales bacterium]|nr:cupredoxin domain-containing protein [Candidatus Saccharimonadales bacterium]